MKLLLVCVLSCLLSLASSAFAQGPEPGVLQDDESLIVVGNSIEQVAADADVIIIATYHESQGVPFAGAANTWGRFTLDEVLKVDANLPAVGEPMNILLGGGAITNDDDVSKRKIVRLAGLSQRMFPNHQYVLYLAWMGDYDSARKAYGLSAGEVGVFDITSGKGVPLDQHSTLDISKRAAHMQDGELEAELRASAHTTLSRSSHLPPRKPKKAQ